MANLREECREVLEPFIQAYGQMCDDLKLKESKRLYVSIADKFIKKLPEGGDKRPAKLSDRRVQQILEASYKEKNKSSRDATALALHRMILLCKKNQLIDGRVMISKRLRPDELTIHDTTAFELLDDFIEIRNWLCERIRKVPRDRKELPQLVIVALIAVNGLCLTNAHTRISFCRREHLNMEGDYPTLDVPINRYRSEKPPTIRYPILPEIRNLLTHLKTDGRWLFPRSFNPDARDRKNRRTKIMNKWLAQLWITVLGKDRDPPQQWTIRTFIICSRLYMAMNSAPIVTGFLSGRPYFASLDITGYGENMNSQESISDSADISVVPNHETEQETNLLLANELIESIKEFLNQVPNKVQCVRDKKKIAFRLLGIAAVYFDLLSQLPCLRHLINWLVWELEHDGNRRRMVTLGAHWHHIPTMLIDELVNVDPTEIDSNQWLKLAEYLIQENTYSPATRSKIKQHLKSFHTYLCNKSQGKVVPINWRRGELKVYTDQGGGIFPTFTEFDRLFYLAAKESHPLLRAQNMAALTLAFFGGLRAEEICLLSKMDIDVITIQVRIWWSKTRQGRRRLPLFLLTPKKYLAPILHLQKNCPTTQGLLFRDLSDKQISPDTLGKRIKKLISQAFPKDRDMSIHTLRHGFASWLLIRYFSLHEPDMLKASRENGSPIIPDADHIIFSKPEQKKLVRVFNGRVAGERFDQNPSSFLSKPEHFAYISKLIGHATRGTTARTYIHSMEWIAYYYLTMLKSPAIS